MRNLNCKIIYNFSYFAKKHHHHHHDHVSVMELDHFLIRSGLTYPEVSSKVYHDTKMQRCVFNIIRYTI